MDTRLPKRAKKTAAGVALAAGLVVALTAGTAHAGGPYPGVGHGGVGSHTDRVILKSNNVSAAATATLTLAPTAPRMVNGAAARVTAEYSCPRGFQGFLEIGLVEATGGHVSQAYGSNITALICNGAKHKIGVSVAVTNDWPLQAGAALGQAYLDTFNKTSEATAATERTITIS